MPAIVQPQFDKFETIEAVLDTDEHGGATARVSYYARDANTMLSLLRRGEACPLVAAGLLQSARFLHGSASSIEGGLWKVDLNWVGLGINLRVGESQTPQYRPIANTSPIDTHPLFENFAGTPAAPKDGVLFDDQGNFERFLPMLKDGTTPNPKAGLKSYYDATLKVSEIRAVSENLVQSQSDWFKVGKITRPDVDDLVNINLDLPGVEGDRDFLLVSVTLEDMGNGLVLMEREWDMSGPFGWDKDIYDYSDKGDAS
jgi:hypothetical protein